MALPRRRRRSRGALRPEGMSSMRGAAVKARNAKGSAHPPVLTRPARALDLRITARRARRWSPFAARQVGIVCVSPRRHESVKDREGMGGESEAGVGVSAHVALALRFHLVSPALCCLSSTTPGSPRAQCTKRSETLCDARVSATDTRDRQAPVQPPRGADPRSSTSG